jgi:heme/copper-type cytochrome/quinol oxidase subunit 4
MDIFSKGFTVALILTVLTVAEYIFAVEVESDLVRFLGLSATALTKAALIVVYFMHMPRLWKKETH